MIIVGIFVRLDAIAARWGCHRSTASRILRLASVPVYLLGSKTRGIVRYLHSDIEAFERSRRDPPHPKPDSRDSSPESAKIE